MKKKRISSFLLFIYFSSSFLFLLKVRGQELSSHELSHFFYQPSGKRPSSKIGGTMNFVSSLTSMNISSLPKLAPISIGDKTSHTTHDIRLKNWELPFILKLDVTLAILYALSPNHSLGFGAGINHERSLEAKGLGPSQNKRGYSSINDLFESKNYKSSQTRAGVIYRGYSPLFHPSFKLHFGSSFYYIAQETNHLLMHSLSDFVSYQPSLEFYLGSHFNFYKKQAFWTKISYKSFLNLSNNYKASENIFQNDFPSQSFYSFQSGVDSNFNRILFRLYLKYLITGKGKFSHRGKIHAENNNNSDFLYSQANRWIFHRKTSMKGALGFSFSYYFFRSLIASLNIEYQRTIKKTELDLDVLLNNEDLEKKQYRLYRFELENKGIFNLFLNLKFEI